MARLGYDADPTDVGEQREFTALSVGDKIMEAIACEIKVEEDGKNKGKQQVVWEFRVTEGLEAGRKHWEWVTIKNPDGYRPPETGDPAQIGQRLNNSFAAAVGLVSGSTPDKDPTDTDNYLFKPVKVYIKAKKPYTKQSGETVTDGRQIGSIKSVGGSSAASSASSGASAGQAAKPAASTGGAKPKAYKDPESGKWFTEEGEAVPFFKLAQYEKVEG